jgi:glycine dehydrogenase
MMFGGPHAGFMAVEEGLMRKIPGRIIGVSKDADGNRCLRMAMQTREQHIRRDKATSNICTAQALLANVAASYAVYHGPDGLREIGQRVHRMTSVIALGLESAGCSVGNNVFFDTLKVKLPSGVSSSSIHSKAVAGGFNLRHIDDEHVGISVDETHSKEDVRKLLAIFNASPSLDDLMSEALKKSILTPFSRSSKYLTHPVFNSHRSETQMLRYLKYLEV